MEINPKLAVAAGAGAFSALFFGFPAALVFPIVPVLIGVGLVFVVAMGIVVIVCNPH